MTDPIEVTVYACGHKDVQVARVSHPLCVVCDAHVLFLSGIPDETQRATAWENDITLHRAECQCPKCWTGALR